MLVTLSSWTKEKHKLLAISKGTLGWQRDASRRAVFHGIDSKFWRENEDLFTTTWVFVGRQIVLHLFFEQIFQDTENKRNRVDSPGSDPLPWSWPPNELRRNPNSVTQPVQTTAKNLKNLWVYTWKLFLSSDVNSAWKTVGRRCSDKSLVNHTSGFKKPEGRSLLSDISCVRSRPKGIILTILV